MKIQDVRDVLTTFLKQEDSYTSILIDGKWGCGKTTQIRECLKQIDTRNIIYLSLFGIKSTDELSSCYLKLGQKAKIAGDIASIGLSAIPIVGSGISGSLSNVLDQFSDSKVLKKKKIFIFDDLERVDDSLSLISLLGFFNNLMLNKCRILCLSALEEIPLEKRNKFDKFTEKAFDRIYHIDEDSSEIFHSIFSNTKVKNIDGIIKGFNGNIRLAKRTSILFQNVDSFVKKHKDEKHDFYKCFTKEELLNCSMMAIRILYSISDDISFSKKELDSFLYQELSEYSAYFGDRISNRFIRELMDKKYIQSSFKTDTYYSLTRDLLYIEMFNNYSFLNDDSLIIDYEDDKKEEILLNTPFFYLNDNDKKKYMNLLVNLLKSNDLNIDSALISKIGDVCSFSDLTFPPKIVKKIENTIVYQVESGDSKTFDKVKEIFHYVTNRNNDNNNCIKTIYSNVSKRINDANIRKMEQEIIKAFKSNNFKVLNDKYYELTEGKLMSQKMNFSSFTVNNNFFLPPLEKSVDYYQWSFCHQVARYCKSVGKEGDFIKHLKEYCKKYPKEKSLKDKVSAMIYYNIDSTFSIHDLMDSTNDVDE